LSNKQIQDEEANGGKGGKLAREFRKSPYENLQQEKLLNHRAESQLFRFSPPLRVDK
jgi:acetylornithine/succinyldiaminopimelate/putrescine aminotransferase